MKRKDTLNTNTIGHFPDGECGVHARTVPANDDSLELLNTLFVALDNTNVNIECITRGKFRDIAFHLCCINEFNLFHVALQCYDVMNVQ